MNVLMNEALAIKNELVELRREIHKNAEIGFELTKTTELVKRVLEDIGIKPLPCGKGGITAVLGRATGKTILLRADMDALPINEETVLEFACKNGNMHACGHDMHTAMLLGAAKLLKKREADLKGCVKLMFQPAEEILCGAENMLKNGVLKSPDVDCAIMLHVMAGSALKTGSIIIPAESVIAPAADYFTINVQGSGCHGSTPQNGIDSINIGAHILLALQEINARELGSFDKAVLTIGKMEGGAAGNVIADKLVMEGTLRTYNEEIRVFIKKRISEIAEATAKTFRGKASACFDSGCPAFINNQALAKELCCYNKVLLGEANVISADGNNTDNSGGSEDFSYISQEVPTVMLILAAGNNQEGYKHSQHHPRVRFDEGALPVGSAVLAHSAVNWLENH